MTPPYGSIKLSSPATRELWQIPILYEDAHLMAVDKPAGLLATPDRYDPNRANLMKLLHRDIERGAHWAHDRGITYLANAHRLDFETSGVMLLAKDKGSLQHLGDQFNTHTPIKAYRALVHGTPEEDRFEIDAKLAHHPTRPWMVRVDPKHGKKSLTRVEVTELFIGYTLLRCYLDSGRQHQIRVHLKHRDCPIVGDQVYGGRPLWLSQLKRRYRKKRQKEEKPLISRVALHAEELQIQHPVDGRQVRIQAPWPNDLVVAVKYLRRFAAKPSEIPHHVGWDHQDASQ